LRLSRASRRAAGKNAPQATKAAGPSAATTLSRNRALATEAERKAWFSLTVEAREMRRVACGALRTGASNKETANRIE
jgi:hypothetical protein